MPKKHNNLTEELYEIVSAVAGPIREIFWPRKYFPRSLYKYGNNYDNYRAAVYRLKRKGSLKLVEKNGKRFLKLTKKGELEALILKATRNLGTKRVWDKKWRLVIYDIPEAANKKRHHLRYLLKANGFKKLQASVFICPYELNAEAVVYLKQSGLMDYIRILRVEKLDDDKGLKKLFGLK